MESYHLKPGGLYFGEKTMVNTLLGSCVSITLWFPEVKKGGMCHMMLPHRAQAIAGKHALDGRYGDDAWAWLKNQVRANLLDLHQAEVKIFGGARALINEKATLRDVGKKNIEFTQRCLKDAGLKIKAFDLGGDGYRILRFNTNTGDVWLKRGEALSQEYLEQWL